MPSSSIWVNVNGLIWSGSKPWAWAKGHRWDSVYTGKLIFLWFKQSNSVDPIKKSLGGFRIEVNESPHVTSPLSPRACETHGNIPHHCSKMCLQLLPQKPPDQHAYSQHPSIWSEKKNLGCLELRSEVYVTEVIVIFPFTIPVGTFIGVKHLTILKPHL